MAGWHESQLGVIHEWVTTPIFPSSSCEDEPDDICLRSIQKEAGLTEITGINQSASIRIRGAVKFFNFERFCWKVASNWKQDTIHFCVFWPMRQQKGPDENGSFRLILRRYYCQTSRSGTERRNQWESVCHWLEIWTITMPHGPWWTKMRKEIWKENCCMPGWIRFFFGK